MSKIVQHEIKDNLLIIDNKEYFPLGLSKIITGVENEDRQEILKDEETGLNYSRNAVEGQEIFNLKNQKLNFIWCTAHTSYFNLIKLFIITFKKINPLSYRWFSWFIRLAL